MVAIKLLPITNKMNKSKLRLLSITFIVLFQLVSLRNIEPNDLLEKPLSRQEQEESRNYYPARNQLITAGWNPCLLEVQKRCNDVAILEDLNFDNGTTHAKEYKSTKYTADINYLYPDELKLAITQNRVAKGGPVYSEVQAEKKIIIKYSPMRYIGKVPSDANINFERNEKVQTSYFDKDIYPITAKLKLTTKYRSWEMSSEMTYTPYENQAHQLFLKPELLTESKDESNEETKATPQNHYVEFMCSGVTTRLEDKDNLIERCYEDPFSDFLSKHYRSLMNPTTSSIKDGLNFYSNFDNHCAIPEFNRFTRATQIVLHLNKKCEAVVADLHANLQDQEYYTRVFRYVEATDEIVQDNVYEFTAEFHESNFAPLEEIILLIGINFKREFFHPTKALIYHKDEFYRYRIQFHITGDHKAILADISDPCFFFKIKMGTHFKTVSIKSNLIYVDETNARVCERLCLSNCQSLKDCEPDMKAIADKTFRMLQENRVRRHRDRLRTPHLPTVLRALDIAVTRNEAKEFENRHEDIGDFGSTIAPTESADAVASEEDGIEVKPITADIAKVITDEDAGSEAESITEESGAEVITGEGAGSEAESITEDGGAEVSKTADNDEITLTSVMESFGGMVMDVFG